MQERMSISPLLCDAQDKKDLELRNTAILFEDLVGMVVQSEDASPYSMGLLLHMHKLTVAGIYPCGGEVRQAGSRVTVSGAHFTPSLPYMINNDLGELLEMGRGWPKSVKTMYENVAFAAQWFHRFLEIHPFMGGNGRVSRTLLTFILYDMGVLVPPESLLPYIESRRTAFIKTLPHADAGDLKPLASFIIRGVLDLHFQRTVQVFERAAVWGYILPRLTGEQRRLIGRAPYINGLSDDRYRTLVVDTLDHVTRMLRKLTSV